ncbi:MAG TPA: YdcF family protein [Xanthobacteraceae bacterium]|nr:YdcF family protein [Xanthobacteraceae bacterium]
MTPDRPPTIAGPAAPESASAQRRRSSGRIGRTLLTLIVLMMVSGALALAGGFLWFVNAVPNQEVALKQKADGIVALTGGTSRIPDAIELLAAGHGKRLLISGVHKTTTPREIARLVPQHEKLVACCVDLDYSAVNTVGNAEETRRWAKERDFRSLIVVTSSYHMPRSLAELARQLPDITLIPFPVVSEKLRAEPWWSSMPTAKLLLSEYLKYVAARLRMRLEPRPDLTDVARARGSAGS